MMYVHARDAWAYREYEKGGGQKVVPFVDTHVACGPLCGTVFCPPRCVLCVVTFQGLTCPPSCFCCGDLDHIPNLHIPAFLRIVSTGTTSPGCNLQAFIPHRRFQCRSHLYLADFVDTAASI